jgi:hypothetical protein
MPQLTSVPGLFFTQFAEEAKQNLSATDNPQILQKSPGKRFHYLSTSGREPGD